MDKCCGDENINAKPVDPCTPVETPCCGSKSSDSGAVGPLAWFEKMIPNALLHAKEAHGQGRPIVGIMCEYTPRELIMAAGGVPACLCGGALETIPAAEEHLPSNLCPLIKSTYGYHVQKSNPFLEMASLLVAETTCDGKKKMYELLAESIPMHLVELPQKENDEDARTHWLKELHKLKEALESRFQVEITEEKLKAAIKVMNRERGLRRSLAELMKCDAPPLTGRELLEMKSSISGIAADLAQYEKALDFFKERGPLPDAAYRVRVLMTGVPIVHGAERVLDIIEDHGGLAVSMENCTGQKPIIEDVEVDGEDPMEALADKYFRLPCSVMTRNERRLELLKKLAEDYHPQAVIELIWQACLTYDVESYRIKRFVEQELELPYLRIETDYSPSDSARIAVRVEALFETVRNAEGRRCPKT
ncbi:MAG: double-cubane-cluster-containing anaerobic reductase [Planctomycetota bacterium]